MASPDLFHSATSSLNNVMHKLHDARGKRFEKRPRYRTHFARQRTPGKARSTPTNLWFKYTSKDSRTCCSRWMMGSEYISTPRADLKNKKKCGKTLCFLARLSHMHKVVLQLTPPRLPGNFSAQFPSATAGLNFK